MSGNRRSNRQNYWRTALTPMIDDIRATIKSDIEGPSARLGEGASRLTAKLFMLDYMAKNDPDEMVYETFQETVEDATKKIQARPWPNKLVYFVRGSGKRTGFENEAFNEAQYVLAYLMGFYKPVEEPCFDTVLEYIEHFPGRDPDSPPGFNAIRLAWDKEQELAAARDEEKRQREQDEEDTKTALGLGFPDLVSYRADLDSKRREQQQIAARERLNQELEETIPMLIENSAIVCEPEKDGGYYFWADPHWRRLKDSVRDRMILRGGRAVR